MTDARSVLSDLEAEQAALDEVVAPLRDDQWALPTPSPRWTVAAQIAHLAYFDDAAATAIADPEQFSRQRDALFAAAAAGDEGVDRFTLEPARSMSPADLLRHWRQARDRLAEAAAGLGNGDRVEWYGPSMGAKSFLTARLMECWAHGQDIVDTVGVTRPVTDRLRHIAQLGVITRRWTFLNRGTEPPEGEIRVELTAPSGDRWTWGPDEADGRVTGSAHDFCLVVTQRRHLDDTALEVTGEIAQEWLEQAQAFAGPPTDGPPAGRF